MSNGKGEKVIRGKEMKIVIQSLNIVRASGLTTDGEPLPEPSFKL